MTPQHAPESLAVITGFAPGIGVCLAEKLLNQGYTVAGLSRSSKGLSQPAENFHAFACDVTKPESVGQAFTAIKADLGSPTVLVYNAAELLVRDFMAIAPEDFERVWRTMCFGALLCAQQVLPDMLALGQGTLLFSGATASIRGSANFAAFASAKFALRGLVQSLARQYGPQGIHVIHTLLDGVIWGDRAENQFQLERGACMEPDDIATTYLHLIQQNPSTWTQEIDLRPWNERY